MKCMAYDVWVSSEIEGRVGIVGRVGRVGIVGRVGYVGEATIPTNPTIRSNQNLSPKVTRTVRGVVYAKRVNALPNVGLFAQCIPSTGVVVNGLNA